MDRLILHAAFISFDNKNLYQRAAKTQVRWGGFLSRGRSGHDVVENLDKCQECLSINSLVASGVALCSSDEIFFTDTCCCEDIVRISLNFKLKAAFDNQLENVIDLEPSQPH